MPASLRIQAKATQIPLSAVLGGASTRCDEPQSPAVPGARSKSPRRDEGILHELRKIRFAIAASPYKGIRSVRAAMVDGQISLQGRVESFYLKQIAQETVRQFISKVRGLRNDIVVEPYTCPPEKLADKPR